jgi:Spy/CpxP family protein refolding chaperone
MKDLHKLRRRWIAIAFAAAAAAGVSATTAFAGAEGMGHGHGHGKWQFDPAKADKHISMMVAHVLENGTPEQKARLTEIAKSCFRDIQPLQQQLGEGHKKVSRMLVEPSIDRASLEVLRSQQMQTMDQLSRRVLQAAMDAADILTVEQREMFNHGLHMMAMSHMHGH